MAQKDKVKELVGRGLDSYHTKALQQIDRINKKNKEQNHKISILSNELDNDYLTKTEEGSVVSLEHSKEGMVYLDELQGNTMVNYCTDGSKEMTLNGDIDVEGTFITTTEGVDNGKVDVMCEGNTMVNIANVGSEFLHKNVTSWYRDVSLCEISSLKLNQDYTFIIEKEYLDNHNNNFNEFQVGIGNLINTTIDHPTMTIVSGNFKYNNDKIEKKVVVVRFTDFKDGKYLSCRPARRNTAPLEGESANYHIKVIILEGDWTDKEIPKEYFKGMQSVGQDDENGHKIEILSQNADRTQQNKKEILINEPLRGLPNGIKDKFVKQNGKWYIERNCLEYKPTSNDGWMIDNGGINGENYLCCYTLKSFLMNNSSYISRMILCDKLPFGKKSFTKEMCCYSGAGYFEFILKVTTLDEFKARLDELKPTVIVPTLTPTYEEITDVELITYLDTTHISNNSTIPCNMKVKNSGYNAIIKPSTLYTIALDTNKSGTIGMNLGGAKVTTTNNVATITTPATLTDDSLRLYGKDIKASKVRLLEGDKTNWIPSHFEGMQSSFEEKLQEDGSYKMEILSEGKNKLNGYNFARSIFNSVKNSVLDTENKTIKYNANDIDNVILKSIKFKKNTRYTIILKGFNSNEAMQSTNIKVIYTDGSSQLINNFIDGISVVVTFEGKTVSHLIGNWSTLTTTLYYDECGIFEGVNVPFEPYKYHNKIQFSSIEPLRSLPNGIKDKFIFKDEKLMIERNCGEIIFDGSEIWLAYNSEYNINNIIRLYTTRPENSLKPNDNTHINYMISDKLFTPSNGLDASSMSNNLHSFSTYISYGTGTLSICLPKSVLSSFDEVGFKEWLSSNTPKYTYQLAEPIYEEIPFELQKIILEGYENGTLFFDTNIPPTSTVTYAGETPIVKSAKSNRVEVASNTTDINDNIIPYLCDMDYRIVVLELQQGQPIQADFYKLFGGVYEMLKRDILSKRLSKSEYEYRLTDYFNVGKLTEQQVRELEDLINE